MPTFGQRLPPLDVFDLDRRADSSATPDRRMSRKAERREMATVRIGRTASRRVLGSMTDFTFQRDAYRRDPMDLEAIALRLADAPCGPLGMRRPADVAVEMILGGG